MNLLLDTHALIWALYDPVKLPLVLRKDLEQSEFSTYFSSISTLEISVKQSLGKLELNLEDLLAEAEKIGLEELPFLGVHAVRMLGLPPVHTDPFDRAIIAQAVQENLILATCDKNIQKYPLTQRWQ